ncbi:MAG: hypothetical protein IJ158_07995 [Treponema sp.]|nr:hypothetical protein [Treponema sp.]
MRKKIKFKSLLSDVFFTVFCLALAVYAFRLFYRDLNAYTSRTDKPALATVTFKHKIAQRKFDDRVVWERIAQNARLYEGDTISTAEGAEASVFFDDGTSLNLYGDTMLRLVRGSDGGLKLSISGGDIQVDTKESDGSAAISIQLDGGSEVKLQKGSAVAVAAKNDGKGESSIDILGGNARVVSATGEEKSLAVGEAVSISENGAISQKEIAVLYPPKDLKLFPETDEDAAQVRIQWKSNAPSSSDSAPVRVQTSLTKNFSSIQSEKIVTKSTEASVFAHEGSLYWRLLSDNEEVGSGKITVTHQKPLVLVSPADKTVFRTKDESQKVTLRWDEAEFASSYRLQVSRMRNFSSPVLDKTTDTPFLSFETSDEGEFFWQVTPIYAKETNGYTQKSKICSFTTEKIENITEPLIINQKAEEEARLAEIARKEEEARLAEIARLEEEARIAEQARIEAEKKQQEEERAQLAAIKKQNEQEKLRLEKEKQAQEQERQRIEAQKRAQNQEKARIENEKRRQAQESERIAAVKKQNELSRLQAEAEKRAQEQERLRIAEEKRLEEEAARMEEAKKQQAAVLAQTKFKETQPSLIAPAANLLMNSDYLKKNRTIQFTWRAVSGADGYIFTLTKTNGVNRTEILSQNLTKPNFALTNLSLLSAGNFEWSVSAYKNAKGDSPALRTKRATGSFKIDITSPQKIDAELPEGMYGS